jgi:hypothetical protein
MLFILIILLRPRSQWVPSLSIKHTIFSTVGRDVLRLGSFHSCKIFELGRFRVGCSYKKQTVNHNIAFIDLFTP